MKNALISLLLLIGVAQASACGDDDVDLFTWGDASLQLSTDFCNALATCGYFGDGSTPDSDKERQQCIDHSNFHLCVLYGTCDEELPEGAEDISNACSVAMEEFVANDAETDGCFFLAYYGAVPEECGAVLDEDPLLHEDEEMSSSRQIMPNDGSLRPVMPGYDWEELAGWDGLLSYQRLEP